MLTQATREASPFEERGFLAEILDVCLWVKAKALPEDPTTRNVKSETIMVPEKPPSSKSSNKDGKIRFFNIPDDADIAKKWIEFCGRDESKLKEIRVCSARFDPELLIRPPAQYYDKPPRASLKNLFGYYSVMKIR
ncbi:hypothetical protein QAD02_021117 [Eretmocerus hayati]|uniref:Uncharacterized protein n=1 Tax=Eretmocerus hayati TaxID=131215 RepID=A0ACC2PRV1_9HYME|nr:hypothetical protein QAD02_021117 [Eretmocerus hayati]